MITVNQWYECPYTSPPALDILKRFKIENIIELGTREGDCAKELSQSFPDSKILTFEANPLAKERCKNALVQSSNVEFFSCAVGSTECHIDFHLYHLNHGVGSDGSSSLYKRHDYETSQTTLKEKISCRRLDSILNEKGWKRVDYLCADIQGYELEALKGLGNYIDDCAFIFLEVPKDKSVYQGAPDNFQITDYMKEKGYKICLEIKENDLESNLLFVKSFLQL